MACEKCGENHNYMWRLMKNRETNQWGCEIGQVIDGEPEVIASSDGFKTKAEAEASATAFINGMLFKEQHLH